MPPPSTEGAMKAGSLVVPVGQFRLHMLNESIAVKNKSVSTEFAAVAGVGVVLVVEATEALVQG